MVCQLQCSYITHSRCVAKEGNLAMSVILINPSMIQRGPVAGPVLAPKISGLSSTCCHVGFQETQSFGQRICPQLSEDSLPYFSPSVHKLPLFTHRLDASDLRQRSQPRNPLLTSSGTFSRDFIPRLAANPCLPTKVGRKSAQALFGVLQRMVRVLERLSDCASGGRLA